MYRRLVILLLSFIGLSSGCSDRKAYCNETSKLKIKRFDTALYNYLNKQLSEQELSEYAEFLDVFGDNVISIGKTDSTGFYERLNAFFAEPTLMNLYKEEQQQFKNLTVIEDELSLAFEILMKEFTGLKCPQVYMHVSGLNQNVIVTDELLSLSADKYLGTDYSLYKEFFYDYQRQNMTPSQIALDYILGYMIANLSFKGDADVLLDRILYEGKLRYLLSRLLPGHQIWEYVAYSKEQYLWCSDNQSRIWKSILQNNHLYHPDYLVTSQYLNDAPHTALLPLESPGRVGVWIGYQIIISYMKNHPQTSLQELMELTDAQELLKQAKYKP